MRHVLLWPLTGAAALATALGTRRIRSDRRAAGIEDALFAVHERLSLFSEAPLDGLPEPAQRYLRHAIAVGTPLAPACRMRMRGTMAPSPDGPPTSLTATETLAPRRGFVWSARACLKGLPVRIRDHYFQNGGGVDVMAFGVFPVPLGDDPDVARSARGRLVAEGVWCPTALVHPDVRWEAVDADRARFTLTVDDEVIPVTIRVGPEGALREVTLNRWGNAEGKPALMLPYGFRVEDERTFEGVTIPTRLTGGWHYGTDRFDPASAASFTVERAAFAHPRRSTDAARAGRSEEARPSDATVPPGLRLL